MFYTGLYNIYYMFYVFLGAVEWIAEEVKQESDNSFRFAKKIDPMDYVVKLAESMHTHEKVVAIMQL